MNRMKKIFGIRTGKVVIFLVAILALITLSVTYNNHVLNKWAPTEVVIGVWQGESEVSAPFKNEPSPSENPKDWISMELQIESDGTVIGTVGEATLVNSKVKKNRTWFETLINIKTDYIIEGQLVDGIVAEDRVTERKITIPFNIVDHELKGSLFELEGWKYPYPILPRLKLTEAFNT